MGDPGRATRALGRAIPAERRRQPASGRTLVLLVALAGQFLSSARADSAPRALLLDAALTGSTIVAVGERGTILRSPDAGLTWRQANRPAAATLTGIAFATARDRGWAVGHDALILHTVDGGRTWTRQYQGENLEDSFLDVLALDPEHAIAIGAYGLHVETANGGKTWTRRKLIDEDYHRNRISRGPTGTLYIAGEHGTLLRSTNQGRRWSRLRVPYEGSFYGVLPLDRHVILAYGLRGHVYRSTNDGAEWTPIVSPAPVLLAAAARLPDGVILLAGHARSMLVSRDEGRTFAPLPHAPAGAIAELLVLPHGRILACGESGPTVFDLDEP